MSDSLFKANRIVVNNDEKRVIDSNEIVSERIRMLTEILESQAAGSSSDSFADDFSEGLDAVYVDQLIQDPDADGGNVISEESMAQFQAEAQRVVDEANMAASETITNANNEAAGIIQKAEQDAEAIRQKARTEGHQQGYDAGYSEGMQAISQMEAELNAREVLMQEEFSRRIDELEPQFISALTDIYSHVLGIDLKGNKQVVAYLIKDAIRNIEGSRNFFVHVSKDDFSYVSEQKDELISGLGSHTTIEIIEDMTLSSSECFVEAESGIFDCSLGTELELLKKELILLSYKKDN